VQIPALDDIIIPLDTNEAYTFLEHFAYKLAMAVTHRDTFY